MPDFSSIQRCVVRYSRVALLGCLGLVGAGNLAEGGAIRFNDDGAVFVGSGVVESGMIEAYRCETFKAGGATYLVLKGKVSIGLGGEIFRGEEAVVRIRKVGDGVQAIEAMILDAKGGAQGVHSGEISFEAKVLRVKGLVKGAVKMKFSGLVKQRVKGLTWVDDFVAEDVGSEAGAKAMAAEKVEAERVIDKKGAGVTGGADVSKGTADAKVNKKAKEKVLVGGKLFGSGGILTHSAVDLTTLGAKDMADAGYKGILNAGEKAICIETPVKLFYEMNLNKAAIERGDVAKRILFTADRAVIIVRLKGKGEEKQKQVDVAAGVPFMGGDVVGLYLEDDVMVTDGDYVIRMPRAYYDIAGGQGIILDAVLSVRHEQLGQPIYVRAAKLRHESGTSWTGEDARVSLSPFSESNLSVGAKKIKFTQGDGSDGEVGHRLKVEGATLGIGGVQVIDLPDFDREIDMLPLREFQPGYSTRGGATLMTRWEMFALLGEKQVDGVTLMGNLDLRGQRGLGLGAEVNYDMNDMFGKMEGYLLIGDEGEDDFTNRDAVGHEGELRGFVMIEHRQLLDKNWEISAEFGYVSDPIYLEQFERKLGEVGKASDASLYVKQVQGQRGFTAEVNSDINGFVAQSGVLQSDGFLVERKPEVGLHVVGQTLLDGRLAYFGESRMGRMRMFGGADSPGDRGFTDAQSRKWFGFGAGETANTSFKDALASRGLPVGFVNRFDTRHEIQAPLKSGVFDVLPYASARLTAYDESYGGNKDGLRLWGGVGVRVHTEFSKTWGDLKSPMLGVDGLRHVVEPVVDINYADSSIDRSGLPEFDVDIEGINDGLSGRVGLRQTFETKRGGVGRERVVDLLVLDTDFVFNNRDESDDVVGRYFGYRPEFSRGGNHFSGEARWQASDRFGVAGNIVTNLDGFHAQQWAAGVSMAHTDGLTSYAEYRDLDVVSSRLVSWGFNYRLTKKYKLGVEQVFAFGDDESRELQVTLVRELPGWQMVTSASFDELNGAQSLFLMFYPKGSKSGRANSRLFKPWGE